MYTIYKGVLPSGRVKIGCDQDYPNRPISQEMTDYRVLETHDDIYIASDRELQLQEEEGLRKDPMPYYMTKVYGSKGALNQLRNGTHNFQKGHGSKGITSPEHQYAFSSAGGRAQKGSIKPKSKLLAKALNKEWTCEYCGKEGKGLGNRTRWGHNNGTCSI